MLSEKHLKHPSFKLAFPFRYTLLLLFLLLLQCTNETFTPPVPAVANITPDSGVKGTTVTIHGENFSTSIGEMKVKFNETPAIVTASDHSRILVNVPDGTSTGNVRVTVGNKEIMGPVFTYIQSGTTREYAGTGFEGLVNSDTSESRFSFPWSADKDAQENIYVADRGNHLIRKITPEGVVSTFAGTGSAGYKDGPGDVAEFNEPVGVAVDASGNVFVSDFINTCIRKITPAGAVTTYAGVAGGIGNANGSLTTARFFGPAGVAFDSQGNLYIADYYNNLIRKITPAGVVSTLAGSSVGCNNGTGTSAQFNLPGGLACDSNGNIYVADSFNHSIRKITPAGVVTRLAGTCSAGSADGAAASATFNIPFGIAVDEHGDVIVVDSYNQSLRKIYTASNTVLTISDTSKGIGTGGKFNAPTGLLYLGRNEYLVVDYGNHKLRKVTIN